MFNARRSTSACRLKLNLFRFNIIVGARACGGSHENEHLKSMAPASRLFLASVCGVSDIIVFSVSGGNFCTARLIAVKSNARFADLEDESDILTNDNAGDSRSRERIT